MAQQRRTIRDFLTGRDKAIEMYRAPFARARNDSEKNQLCDSLNREYHQQCGLYKREMNKEMRVHIVTSLTSFTEEVVKFTESLKSPMTRTQAAVILKAGRLLRLCVAGRSVFSEICVKERDVGHLIAENMFGKALIALNNQRSAAVTVLSQKGGSKGGKLKKGKKKTSSKPRPNINNLYEVLIDSVDDVADSIAELSVDEEVKGVNEEEKEVSPFPVENLAADADNEVSLDDFLNAEIEFQKDLIHDILQSDHISSISDTLWGDGRGRSSVHVRAFNYVGLPPEDVLSFIHIFKNRFLFNHLGTMLSDMTRTGQLERRDVASFFNMIVNFAKGLNSKQLELLSTIGPEFWMHNNTNANNIPIKEGLNRKMRYLSMVSNTDPLFVSYMSYFSYLMRSLFDDTSGVADHRHFIFHAQMFGIVPKYPTIGEIILEGKVFDESLFDRSIAHALEGGKTPSSTVEYYTPTFVSFFDSRVPPLTRKPMRLPVEILQDDDVVKLRIHQVEVDEYVTDLLKHNSTTLHVFIPSSHLAYYPANEYETLITRGKSVTSVIHLDQTETILEMSGERDIVW